MSKQPARPCQPTDWRLRASSTSGAIPCHQTNLANDKPRTAKPADRPASWIHTGGRPKALGLPSALRPRAFWRRAEAFALRPKPVFGRRVAQAGRRAAAQRAFIDNSERKA